MPLWAFVVCSRVDFTFTFTFTYINFVPAERHWEMCSVAKVL